MSQSERENCFRAFGPKPAMQIYQRGIRRRLAPMFGGRLDFAHSCQDENGNAVIAAHNLTEAPIKVVIKLWEKTFDHFIHLFDERPNEKIKNAGIGLELSGFGFSWLRLRQKKQI